MSLCLHEKLFRTALETPDAEAVIYEENETICHMTYGELAEKALKLAGQLHEAGLKKGDLAAVRMSRGTGQIISVYAILALGAAYVPINVRHPAGRVENICKKGNINIIVTDMDDTDHLEIKKISISDTAEPLKEEIVCDENALAYIIFTSGSTGEPKGVMIKHSAAMNTINDVNERFGIGADDTAINLSEIDFDLSVYDMFGIINAGGKLLLLNESDRRDPKKWLDLTVKNNVTVWNSVPAIYEMLMAVAEGKNSRLPLKKVMLSGDWIPLGLPALTKRFCDEAMFISLGGATEASIWSNYYIVEKMDEKWHSIPYGKALANQELMVIDSEGKEAAVGVEGELHIGGKGVAEGYLQDEALTEAAFYTKNGQRWYKTGDLAMKGEDGNYFILGRIDHQVKINGYRIELGEIENTINNISETEQSVVMVSGNKKILAAYSLKKPHPTECSISSVEINCKSDDEKSKHMEYAAGVMMHIMGLNDDTQHKVSDYSLCSQAYISWLEFLEKEKYITVENDTIKVFRAAKLSEKDAEKIMLLKAVFYGKKPPEKILESDDFAPEKLVLKAKETEYLLNNILSESISDGTKIAVLDCRMGAFAKEIIRLYPNAEVTLFDRSQGMLEAAKETLGTSACYSRYTDYLSDKANKGRFDIVISANTLHTWNEPDHALLTAEDILRPSGEFYALEYSEMNAMGLITSALIENGFVSGGKVSMPFRNVDEWADILKTSPFAKAEIISVNESDAFFIKAVSADIKTVPELEKVLSEKLTAYMMPDRFTEFLWYPLTENGKVDRKKIKEILSSAADETVEIQLDGTALDVWNIWKEYLGADLDSTDKNFFEAGGDSLLATKLLVRIQKKFGVEILLSEMLESSTVSQMAELIERRIEEEGDVLEGEI